MTYRKTRSLRPAPHAVKLNPDRPMRTNGLNRWRSPQVHNEFRRGGKRQTAVPLRYMRLSRLVSEKKADAFILLVYFTCIIRTMSPLTLATRF